MVEWRPVVGYEDLYEAGLLPVEVRDALQKATGWL
jgi:hypothetical protein